VAGDDAVGESRRERVEDRGRAGARGVMRQHRLRPGRAAGAVAEVDDDVVDAGLDHGQGLVDRGAKCLGEHPHPRCGAEHVDFAREAHAGFFQRGAKRSVHQSDGRAVHDTVIAGRRNVREQPLHVAGRIDTQEPGDQGTILDDIDEGARADLERQRVRVADRQIARHRT
jgi:hypothetical protein